MQVQFTYDFLQTHCSYWINFSSQILFLFLLCDASGGCHILNFQSRKSQRLYVRSALSAECFAFNETLDAAYMIAVYLYYMHERIIHLLLFTHSLQLFDSLTKGKRLEKRQLTIDIFTARQSFKSYKITIVDYIRGNDNPAGGLTKI